MRGDRAVARCAGLGALLLLPAATARAQVAPNRAALYLHPTDVTDARALWVNPGGLGRVKQASLHVDLTVSDPGSAGRLRQLTAGLESRGLSLGYQRDVFSGGVRWHTYRVGFAGGERRLAAGIAAALYRGGTSTTGWDAGVVYDLTPALTIGGVIANIGRPLVRDSALRVSYLPGATLRLLAARAALSADARITTDGVAGYAFGGRLGLRESTLWPLRILLRLDTGRSLRRAALVLGCSLGGQDLVGVVASAPGDARRLDGLSLYGVTTRRLTR